MLELLNEFIKMQIIKEASKVEYRLNTVVTKSSRIIVNELKKFLLSDTKRSSFRIDKTQVSELLDFEDLLLTINFMRVNNIARDDTETRGFYEFDKNEIIVSTKINNTATMDTLKSVFSSSVLLIKSTLRHELEHAIQAMRRFEEFETDEIRYFERPTEIEAHANEFYYRLKKGHKLHDLTKLRFYKLLNIFVDSIGTLRNTTEKNKFKKAMIAYLVKRYPILHKIMANS